jgi:hypothetical protein
MLTTPRRGIQYPDPGTRADRADIALHISSVATAADVDVIFDQGTDAARIAAAHQAGGGRFWWTTDTHLLWYDDGANWQSVAPTSSAAGTLGARPAANTLVAGSSYFATDQVVPYITDGANWIRTGMPAGGTVEWFKPDAAVPAGWVLYDGTNLPAAIGIYADLYAHLGNTLTKPDTRGRGTVGLGTHSDVSAVGVNDGLAVASRTPKHNSSSTLTLPNHGHSVTDPGHNHGGLSGQSNMRVDTESGGDYPYGSGVGLSTLQYAHQHSIPSGATGLTVGNPSSLPAIAGSIGPGGTRPIDSGAYIVCAKIGKL